MLNLEQVCFNGIQIRKLMRSSTFDEVLSEAKNRAWIISFKNVSTEYLEENA